MNYRNVAVGSVVAGLMAGCAYLPTDTSSRSAQFRHTALETKALFTKESAVPGAEVSETMPTATGLKVRKAKRGNMDSYVVRGQRYFTLDESDGYSARGLASWYGPNFHGRTASNGEVYDMYKMTAAHKTLPLPTFARVTHIDNGKSIVVKINDRGPFSGDRLIDLSFAAALELGMVNDGTAMVEVQAIGAEELALLSGPKNSLGVDFYYEAGETPRNAVLPVSELFVSDATVPEDAADGVVVVAEPFTDQNVEVTQTPVVQSSSTAAAELTAGVNVAVPTVKPGVEYLEVVVPGRDRPTENTETTVTSDVKSDVSELFSSETGAPVDLAVLAVETDPAKDIVVQEAVLPLIGAAAVAPSVAVGTVPATVAPKKAKPVDSHRYYIQAGVYADVLDAEKIAVDIVLKIPEEEVHVKPLKNSAMYRVTVGPITTGEHAKDVAASLTDAGLENYTVKVNEN